LPMRMSPQQDWDMCQHCKTHYHIKCITIAGFATSTHLNMFTSSVCMANMHMSERKLR
jgi:hypothetical protein